MELIVERVHDLDTKEIEPLVKESEAEGYRFVTRLVTDYDDGTNKFSEPGEALFLIRNDDREVVAIGGVNLSVFPKDKLVGRLQRFYVLESARRHGIGSKLLHEIIEHARGKFKEMTVRTESSKADAFYRANGFDLDDSSSETTHIIQL